MLPGFCPLGLEVSGPRHFGVESVHRVESAAGGDTCFQISDTGTFQPSASPEDGAALPGSKSIIINQMRSVEGHGGLRNARGEASRKSWFCYKGKHVYLSTACIYTYIK